MTKKKQSTEAAVREIRRRTRRKFAPEEKVRIVLEGLRGEQSNPCSFRAAEFCYVELNRDGAARLRRWRRRRGLCSRSR